MGCAQGVGAILETWGRFHEFGTVWGCFYEFGGDFVNFASIRWVGEDRGRPVCGKFVGSP